MFQYATEGVKLRTKIQDMTDTVYIHRYLCCTEQMNYIIRMWKHFSFNHFAMNVI